MDNGKSFDKCRLVAARGMKNPLDSAHCAGDVIVRKSGGCG